MIKSFRAKNLSEALRNVRLELGPDAIILETKQRYASRLSWSRSRVEVIASNGPPPENYPSQQPSAESTSPPEPKVAECDSPHPSVETSARKPPSYPLCFVQVGSELLKRDLPREQIETWLEEASASLGTAVQDPWVVRAYLAQRLRHEIPIDPPTHAWTNANSTIAVVGPPGHGKSNSVAKLASIASMHLGLRPLVISCVHPSATPPHPRLADYCELIGCGYKQVDAPKLASAIARGREHSDWIALDVPSVPLGDFQTMDTWRSLLEELGVTQTHFTISATTATAPAGRLLDWYHGLAPTHLLVTHLDEAFGLGGFYSFLSSARIPLGFATFGPHIPEDIDECDTAQLAHWILGGPDH